MDAGKQAPEQYRKRAIEARAQAALLQELEARAMLLQIAQTYEALADRIERRVNQERA